MRSVIVVLLLLGSITFISAPASAYDTGPHNDLTHDVLASEGFGEAAGDIAAVDNWFSDFYSQADKNPYSGHGDTLSRIISVAVFTEKWPQRWVDAANMTHFDSTRTFAADAQPKNLASTEGVAREWVRLMRNTNDALQQARRNRDPLQLLAAIGISLHSIQDFYTHSNWVEPANTPGFFGPGWKERGYGDFPTWFDIPKGELDGSRVQMAGAAGVPRGHGGWKDDDNRTLGNAGNKDTPARPLFQRSYITAYFASRAWVRAMRTWLGDDRLWQRAQRIRRTSELARDIEAALEISLYTGRWAGSGGPCVPSHDGGGRISCGPLKGPAGSLVNLRQAIKAYFETPRGLPRGPTAYRRAFQQVLEHFGKDLTQGEADPSLPLPPASTQLQRETQFVQLQVRKMRGLDLGDPGPDDADLFARASIAGQPYHSTVIHGHDSFSFSRPHGPFTWIKAVPVGARFARPVTDIKVRIKTGNVRYAGTDDDVTVNLGPGLTFTLDKRLYDDFERGDDDTYELGIDSLTKRGGITLGDITQFVIRKSRDGVAGGWRLGGAQLIVNGRELFRNDRIDRWLEDDRRTFTGRVTRDHRTTPAMPVWLELMEDDLVYGADDKGDINPFDRRRLEILGYAPGPLIERTVTGGRRLSGRLGIGNGDKGRITYRLETVRGVAPPVAPVPTGGASTGPVADPTPETTPDPTPTTPDPVPTPDPGPQPAGRPDLVITALTPNDVTVKNIGTAPAGAFTVTVVGFTPVRFPGGLAGGASETKAYPHGPDCGGVYRATADSLSEVAESNEANNTFTTTNIVC